MGSESRKLCAVVKTVVVVVVVVVVAVVVVVLVVGVGVGKGEGEGEGEGEGVAIRPPTPRNFSKRTTWISGLFRLSKVVRDKPAMPVSMTEISNVAFFVMIGPN